MSISSTRMAISNSRAEDLREQVMCHLDRYEAACDRLTIAQVNAGHCGTRTDWAEQRAAEEHHATVRDQVVDAIMEMILR